MSSESAIRVVERTRRPNPTTTNVAAAPQHDSMSEAIKRFVKWLLNSPQPKPDCMEPGIHASIDIDAQESPILVDKNDMPTEAIGRAADCELLTMPLERLVLLPAYLVPNARKEELRRFIHLRKIKKREEWESLFPEQDPAEPNRQFSANQVVKSGGEGSVYVIQDLRTGLYKIGLTTNMKRRMRELGVGETARLVKERKVDDAVAVEKAAHKRYKAHRLRQTEYFNLSEPPEI